jgi:hypothetical protein
MSFVPYGIYDVRLPKLKPGYFINAAGKFYQIMTVMNNRQSIDLALGYTESAPLILNVTVSNTYEALHGNIATGRVVQLQYFALTTTVDVLLRWGTLPLLSNVRNIYVNSNSAGLTNPIQIDRWSHDREMRLAVIKAAGAQVLWLEIVEYEVVEWTKTPPKEYLKILDNGQAVFVRAGAA